MILSNDELDALNEACNVVAHDNWDAHVEVSQDDQEVLTFKLVDKDGGVEDRTITATHVGEFVGSQIWDFKEPSDPEWEGVRGTLVAKMILGLMAL